MAKITIEELSGSLKEYLNGLGLTEAQVQELIDKFEDEKIGDISQLSTEEKGSLVGAINELFQNANNGKQIIADAIGSPLSGDDTFAAMGNEINQMITDFRNALAVKGVNAPADKMEGLIEKIGDILQEGSVLNNYCYETGTYEGVSGTIPINLSFEPLIIFCKVSSRFTAYTVNGDRTEPLTYNMWISNLNTTSTKIGGAVQSSPTYDMTITDVSSESFTISGGSFSHSTIEWYAIGSSQLQHNGGERTITPSTTNQTLPLGYYAGEITVSGDSDLVAGNIKSGVNIFGITGTAPIPSGNATASQVLTGYTFSNGSGVGISGTMANNGAKTFTPSASNQTSGAGYYSSVTCNAVANLTAANIKQGVTVGGVTGTCVPGYTLSSSPSYGDAIAGAMQGPTWCQRGTTILSYTSKFAGKVRVCIPLYKLSSSVYSSEKLTFMVNGTSKQVITLDTHLGGTSFAFSTVYSDLTINKGDVVTVKFDGSGYGATIYRVGWFILCTFV